MTKTLAELRATKPGSLPTRSVTICLDQALLAKAQRLEAEKTDLMVAEARRTGDGEDREGPPRRQGEGPNPRISEIDEDLAALYDEMRASEGDLLLRATSGGKWARWKDDHPARDGNQSDETIAYGFCNASDLLDDLGTYVAEWNGEPLAADDWSSWLCDQVAPADLRALCSTVVEMHETRITVPKSRSASSAGQTSANGSTSPSA